MSYLVSGGFVRGHVTLQLCAVAEGVGTQRTGEALLVLLVPIFDVFLQRCQTFVAAVAVRTREQLGEVVRSARKQICSRGKGVRSSNEGWWTNSCTTGYNSVLVPHYKNLNKILISTPECPSIKDKRFSKYSNLIYLFWKYLILSSLNILTLFSQ